MNELTKFLIQELLDTPKTVAIYGGGFKPPTKGHFLVVEKALQKLPEIDEFKIFVGSGVRDGITQEESIKIWELYKPYLSDKISIEPSAAPVKSILGYAKDHPDEKVYWILGTREGNEDDLKDIENRTKSLSKYPNIEVVVINTQGGVSGTNTRTAVRNNDKELFFNLIPDIKEKEQIWNLVSPVIKEVGEASLKPYKWEEVDREGYWYYVRFTTDNDVEYEVDLESIIHVDKNVNELKAFNVEFIAKPKGAEGYSDKIVVNKGEMYRVMSTIADIIKYYVKKYKAQAILYSPSKKGNEDFGSQRDQLYKAFIKKALPGVYFEQKGDWIAAILPKTLNEADPKVGTGKKPKGSGRRLYTDEDPKDTVSIKFKTKEDIVDTLNKTSFKDKSHVRQSQVINLIHQRVRAAYGRAKDPEVKSRLKRALDYIEKRKEMSKKKTERLRKMKEASDPQAGTALPYGSGFAPVKEIVTDTEVICDNCGWEWDIKDGGDDLYICHKCGHDNTPKENQNKAWNLQEGMLSLSKYMIDNGMNIKPLPKVKMIKNNKENADNMLGNTAYYNPTEKSITLFTLNRHPKDILRSFAHEMVHHMQNLEGRLNNIQTTNTNEDGDLPEIEREAYEKGNMMLRNWEDSIKNV